MQLFGDAPFDAEKYMLEPWKRLLARSIDYFLFLIALLVLLSPFYISFTQEQINLLNNYLTDPVHFRTLQIVGGVMFMSLWVFVEAWFLSVFNTTPGKSMLSIRVTTPDGGKMSYQVAFKRSASVWALGMGLGLPWVMYATGLMSYLYLVSKQDTFWDNSLNLRVAYGPLTKSRAISIFIVISLLLVITLTGERP